MIKLYKNTDDGLCYAECWVDDDMATVHLGAVGSMGECWEEECGNAKIFLKKFKAKYEAEGYTSIPDSQMCWIKVSWETENETLSPEDEARIEKAYDSLNEAFGWTGLGYADGFDTNEKDGRYFVTLYALSVDRELGIAVAKNSTELDKKFKVEAEDFE